MSEKIGADFARDMVDRGRRELGGALYADSNVAQPMYPLRGGYEPSKESESPAMQEDRSVLESRLRDAEVPKDDLGRDDKGIERE